jgi:hypothetical protein
VIPVAWRAIAATRLMAERRTIAYAFAAAVVVAFVQPSGLAAPLFFCGLLGVAVALTQGPGRHRHLDLCEESAPLYGRELARAKALAPCAVAAFVSLAYWGAQWLAGFPASPLAFAQALAAVIACTLVALDATIRTGAARLLYLAMACATGAIAFTIAFYARSAVAEMGFCAAIALVALRQYGEALARYDPV